MGIFYQKTDISLLERSIRSILAQTFEDFELLICDSGSCVEAVRFLNAIATEDSRIRLIREERLPTDLAHKLNLCLKHARGKLVARMDDDDFSHPERFQLQKDFLDIHPEIAFVGCNVALQSAGKQIGKRVFPEYPQVSDFYMTQPFIHPTLMFRKESLEKVGGYSEHRRCILCEDYDLLLRLYENNLIGANLQEPCFTYTLPPKGTSNRTWKMRCNEVYTRWMRFKSFGVLPMALPYVIKPIIVGLIPQRILRKIKEQKICRT